MTSCHVQGVIASARSARGNPVFSWLVVLLLLPPFPAFAAEIRVDHAACEYVMRHVPDADVAYRPGVDASGDAVVPPDLNASPVNEDLKRRIVIKLTNQTAKVFGLDLPVVNTGNGSVPLAEAETEIGYVTLEKGRAFLNGKPLSPASEAGLAALCKRHESR